MPSYRETGSLPLPRGQASAEVPVGEFSGHQGLRRSTRNRPTAATQVSATASSVASTPAATATNPSLLGHSADPSTVLQGVGDSPARQKSPRLGNNIGLDAVDLPTGAVSKPQQLTAAMPTSVSISCAQEPLPDSEREVYYELGPLFASVGGVSAPTYAKSLPSSMNIGNSSVTTRSVDKDSNVAVQGGGSSDVNIELTSTSLLSPKKRSKVRLVYEFIYLRI